MMSDSPDALIDQRGHVLIVTMNRPRARNALSPSMMALMRQAWDQVDADPGIRACDIRVAGESARFEVSEARWGLFPLGGSAVRLPRQIPYTVAAELLLTGRHIRAAEALSMGLIGHVVPDGQALEKALEIADAIAANGPVAVRAILAAMRETEGMAEADAFAIAAKLGAAVFASDDAREGPRAFAEKRRPEFRDG
jgi:enoyl-CoA hydratase